MFRSSAGYTGLPSSIGESGGNTYLYGISDFWALMFEDTELVERMLEQYSMQMADVYSQFLQLTSSISLEDVQAYTHSELKLLTIRNISDLVEGTTYRLPENFVNCKYILNRPMLPTVTLENGVHFDIDADAGTITFFAAISEINMPSREILDPELGVAIDNEYALWATDVVTDEDLVFKFYGQYVGFEKQSITTAETYKNFIRGLYFLYVNGPVIKFMEQGLSLALGVPIARETEEILSIVRGVDTESYIVVTATNSYTIPYDIEPDFKVGDTIDKGNSLLRVATISDYTTDPDWWENIAIPFDLVERIGGKQYGDYSWYGPNTESDRIRNHIVASSNPVSDPEQQEMYWLMDTFLKNHTFLVKLTWQASFGEVNQSEVLKLISTAKPSYTYAVQVWEIPLGQEVLTLKDEDEARFRIDAEAVFRDSLGCGDAYIDRAYNPGAWQPNTAYDRFEIVFPNYEVPGLEDIELKAICRTAGTSAGVEIDWANVSNGDLIVDGTINWRIRNIPGGQQGDGLNPERGDSCYIHSNFDPALITEDEVNVTYVVPAKYNYPDVDATFNANDGDLIPLYNCTLTEARRKLLLVNVDPGICMPELLAVSGFDGTDLYASELPVQGVGVVNESLFIRDYDGYVAEYGEGYFGTGYNFGDLGLPVSIGEPYRAYFPDPTDITTNETIIAIKASSDIMSFFWYKPGGVASLPSVYFEVPVADPCVLSSIPLVHTPMLTPVDTDPGLVYSNNHLTVEALDAFDMYYTLSSNSNTGSGKYWVEFTVNERVSPSILMGISDADDTHGAVPTFIEGHSANTIGRTAELFTKAQTQNIFDVVGVPGPVTSLEEGDVVNMAVNLDNNFVEFYVNGVVQGSSALDSSLSHRVFVGVRLGSKLTVNLHQDVAFTHLPPAGYTDWNGAIIGAITPPSGAIVTEVI